MIQLKLLLTGNGKKYNVCSYEEVTSLARANKKVTEIFKYKFHFPSINSDPMKLFLLLIRILDKKGYEVFDKNGNLIEFKSFWIGGKELDSKVNLSYQGWFIS